jgi:ribosomal protein S18 acetylase RimI-like enzyme
MINYVDSVTNIGAEQLTGFFAEWPNKPTPETLLRILRGSDHVVLAVDATTNQVVGYITAISDGVSAAYIPHLEVRHDQRGEGIGSELVRRMLDQLRHLYMIDLTCDPDVQSFYQRLGLRPSTGMFIRNYERQSCDPLTE